MNNLDVEDISGRAFYKIIDQLANKNPDNYANILSFNVFSVMNISPRKLANNAILGDTLQLFWSVYAHNIVFCEVLDGDYGTPITSTNAVPHVVEKVRSLINCKALRTLLKHDSKNQTTSVKQARTEMMSALKMVPDLNRITNSVFQYLKCGDQVLAKFTSTFTKIPYDPKNFTDQKSARQLINAGIAEGLKQIPGLFINKKQNNKGGFFYKYSKGSNKSSKSTRAKKNKNNASKQSNK